MFKRGKGLQPKKTVKLAYGTPGFAAASVDLIKKNGISFEKKVDSAVSIQKSAGLNGLRFDVIGLLDESGSMGYMFRDGTVQTTVERALAWTAGVDADGLAPFGGFASGFKWHGDVDLSNVMGIVDREGWTTWGSTDLAAGLKAALDLAKQAENPVYLLVVTDGAPNDRSAVVDLIEEMSQYPIFIKVLLLGNDHGGYQFVRYLDDMDGLRLFDNLDAQHIPTPSALSDDEFNSLMTEELSVAVDKMKYLGLAQ